jgi:hypothetical protein
MTDQLETSLRAQFEADSAGVPVLGARGLDDLTRTARSRVRARRRRTAAVCGAVTLVLAAAVPFGVREWDSRSQAGPATPGPTPSTVVSTHTAPFDPVPDGVLHFRGVTVPVPKVMLEPGNRRCGSSLVDAAWWEGQHTAQRLCLIDIPTGDLDEVSLRAAAPGEPVSERPRRTVLKDGRTVNSVGFPDRGVVLRVVSGLATRAEGIVASARQLPAEGQIDGCRIKDPGDLQVTTSSAGTVPGRGGSGQSGADADIAPEPAVSAVVCGYREHWLVGTRVLGPDGASELAARLNDDDRPVSELLRDCKTYDGSVAENGAWEIRLLPEGGAPVMVRATPFRCQEPPVINDQGVERALAASLAEYLAGLATGPVAWWGGEKLDGSQVP